MTKLKFLFLIVHCTLVIDNCFSQWQPDVRLTNDPANSNLSYNNAWCIAASGNDVHVVWYDLRDGNNEIYYKRSTDGGVSWGADTRLTNTSFASRHPSVTVSGSIVHVVWREGFFVSDLEIYYKRSTDGGVSWGADARLTNNSAEAGYPSVSVSDSTVHIVWDEQRVGNWEIYYKRSTDGGTSWGADARLTNNGAFSDFPSGAVSGQVVHVVWFDFRDATREIYYKRSTDEGLSWGADVRLSDLVNDSEYPSVSVSGSFVHVVWYDNRDGNDEIYYKRSTDGGISWGADARLTSNSSSSDNPSVSVSGSTVHVVWDDNRDGNREIYYKRSTDGGVSWGTDLRLTVNSAESDYSFVSVSGQVVHVVWEENRDGNSEIYYKRDPTGNVVGIININSEIPNQFSLSQNYPNPFNPSTVIKFQVASSSSVKLIIYDALGREMETLVNEQLNAGTYEADFDGTSYPSGVYYYKLTAEDYTDTKRMVLLK